MNDEQDVCLLVGIILRAVVYVMQPCTPVASESLVMIYSISAEPAFCDLRMKLLKVIYLICWN